MDLYSSIVDIIFLIAIIFISYKTPLYHPIPLRATNTEVTTTITTDPPHSASTPTSPNPSMVVPTITITPDRPVMMTSDRQVAITPDRQVPATHHKRKSVTFSLSSIEELHDPIMGVGKHKDKRPPTPFIVLSPSSSPVPSLPGTPMGDSRLAVDPMGVEKRWLMG